MPRSQSHTWLHLASNILHLRLAMPLSGHTIRSTTTYYHCTTTFNHSSVMAENRLGGNIESILKRRELRLYPEITAKFSHLVLFFYSCNIRMVNAPIPRRRLQLSEISSPFLFYDTHVD
ncbi:hypothetical protein CPB83DRAFT_407364 [Crepidotus variabilis]|uniref:Uncharacterized protein n=1 Tax=Crepidotus variabilis TaxID=179855 RepID=A0A9P6ERW9_9AGAR|nr:hypothetical protein CPB83DRAFT_407364 [Crepidotus variabilis]